jgi:hypothetical protein
MDQDSRNDEVFGIFFSSNPHMDPLLPGFLVNGFEIRHGARFSPSDFYPMADSLVRTLLSTVCSPSPQPDFLPDVVLTHRAHPRMYICADVALQGKEKDGRDWKERLLRTVRGNEDNDKHRQDVLGSFSRELVVFQRNRVVFPFNRKERPHILLTKQ